MLRVRIRQGLSALAHARWRGQASIGGGIYILMYHSIPKDPLPDDAMQLTTPPATFLRHLEALAEAAIPVISMKEAVARLSASTSPKGRAVVITFDDGYIDVATEAAPLLAEFGFPATLFCLPAYHDVSTSFPFVPAGRGYSPSLTWSDLCALQELGWKVGVHSMTHQNLARLSPAQLREEIISSRSKAEERLGHRVNLFAYPFGSFHTFNSTTERVLREEGFVAACTNVAGVNTRPDLFRLRRQRLSWVDATPESFLRHLTPAYNWYAHYQRTQSLVLGLLGR